MINKSNDRQRGFSAVELSVVCVLVVVALAIATPQITSAMRTYRINIAMRQVADLVAKAKVEAVAENRNASLVVDTANRRLGLIVYDNSTPAVVLRTEYISLPQGVSFSRPANNSAPMTGAPTGANVSFAAQGGSSTVFQQNFTSRGFLQGVVSGTINAVYFGDGKNYRALTLTSVGGFRTWKWDNSRWESMRH
jgi:Tfp pilus assembly protein FimT